MIRGWPSISHHRQGRTLEHVEVGQCAHLTGGLELVEPLELASLGENVDGWRHLRQPS